MPSRNPVAKNNRHRPQVVPNRRVVDGPRCDVCGRPGEPWQDYVNGHLHCECGRNVDECCQGERDDE